MKKTRTWFGVRIQRLNGTVCYLFLCGGFLASVGILEVQAVRFENRTASLSLTGLVNSMACWVDYNCDGWVDLYAGGVLYRNNNGTGFTVINSSFGGANGVWGDFNNDGYPDMFDYSSYRMFRNINGNGTFTQIPIPTLPMNVTIGASWADHNNDGYIDLYVGGYENPGYLPDAILRNSSGTSFTLVWTESGDIDPGRGITSCDFDEDGDQDIYVSNYRLEANDLLRNNGSGIFTDVAPTYGVEGINDGWSYSYGHTIGSCWGDFDNDGHFDLFVGNFSHPDTWQDRPRFYRNLSSSGSWHFQDKSSTAGLAWQESYASPALGDFDNDGDLDLYFTTVYATSTSGVPNYPVLYRNNGNWTFTDVTAAEGLANLAPTYQAAWADFNHDGKLDLVTAGQLFVNTGSANHWLEVQLQSDGSTVNRSVIGAQVRVSLGTQTLTRQVEAGTGQGNENDFTLHFGLGSNAGPVNVEIRWPNRTTSTFSTPVDRIVVQKRGTRLQVTPTDNFSCTGPLGGPFAPSSKTYTLTNLSSNLPISWQAEKSQSWITLTPDNGTLAAGASINVTVSLNAGGLKPGSNSGTVTFRNVSNSSDNTSVRTVSATVHSIQVTPTDNLTASGRGGGPFTPSSKTYTLTNLSSSVPLSWQAVKNQSWITVTPDNGTLAAGASTTVTIALGTLASELPFGPNHAAVTFRNAANSSDNTSRTVSLTVNGYLWGMLFLEGYQGSYSDVACIVQLWKDGNLYRAEYVAVDDWGFFGLDNVAAGTYKVKLLVYNWLFKALSNVGVVSMDTWVDFPELPAGDADNDNAVTADDLMFVLWGLEDTEYIWPDLDGDGEVNSTDLALVLKNLGLVGDP